MRIEWKRILNLAALGAFLAMTPAANAQSSETSATAVTGQEMSDLKLTDEQKSQVQAINQSRREQIRAIAQDKSLSGEQRAARIREINHSSNQRIRGLLNTEQQARFDRRLRDRREDVRDRREDVRDRRHDGGARDRREDVRDRREDRRDRRTPSRPRRP